MLTDFYHLSLTLLLFHYNEILLQNNSFTKAMKFPTCTFVIYSKTDSLSLYKHSLLNIRRLVPKPDAEKLPTKRLHH